MALLAAEIAAWAEPVLCAECDGVGSVETVRAGFNGEPIYSDHRCDECEDGHAMCADCGHTPAFLRDRSYDRLCEACLLDTLDADEELLPWRNELALIAGVDIHPD